MCMDVLIWDREMHEKLYDHWKFSVDVLKFKVNKISFEHSKILLHLCDLLICFFSFFGDVLSHTS